MGHGAHPVLLAALLLVGYTAGGLRSAHAASTPNARAFSFGEQPGSITPTPRIAIVSEKAFHLEVLAGFIAALEPYAAELVVYLHPMNFENVRAPGCDCCGHCKHAANRNALSMLRVHGSQRQEWCVPCATGAGSAGTSDSAFAPL